MSGAGNQWTVMVYMAADNDLDISAHLDIQEMQSVGSTENVTVLLQYDTRSRPTDGTGWKKTVSNCSRNWVN